MMRLRCRWIIGCCTLLFGLTVACNDEGPVVVPTEAPVAAIPTEAPVAAIPTATSSTTLPPTRDLATATPAATMTVAPSPTPDATETPAMSPQININVPEDGTVLQLGDVLAARGLAQVPPSHSLEVVLLSQTNQVLTTTQATLGDVGWQAELTIPLFVGGSGRLAARILDDGGEVVAQDTAVVWLEPDTAVMERYLTLSRPTPEETAVAGFNVLFDGRIQNPVNNTVTIAIWTDDCQTPVAQQSFVLGSSQQAFPWHGFVIVPNNVSGAACAVASFGAPEDASRREMQVPITIYAPDTVEGKGVTIARPLPETTYTAGESLFIYGTAQDVSEGPVAVSVLLENGRIVAENPTTTDFWGYWELEVILPVDVEGPAEVTVSTGEPDSVGYAEDRLRINIAPPE